MVQTKIEVQLDYIMIFLNIHTKCTDLPKISYFQFSIATNKNISGGQISTILTLAKNSIPFMICLPNDKRSLHVKILCMLYAIAVVGIK